MKVHGGLWTTGFLNTLRRCTPTHTFWFTCAHRFHQGAWLVNTARGAICDKDAVARALASGHLRGKSFDPKIVQVTKLVIDLQAMLVMSGMSSLLLETTFGAPWRILWAVVTAWFLTTPGRPSTLKLATPTEPKRYSRTIWMARSKNHKTSSLLTVKILIRHFLWLGSRFMFLSIGHYATTACKARLTLTNVDFSDFYFRWSTTLKIFNTHPLLTDWKFFTTRKDVIVTSVLRRQ